MAASGAAAELYFDEMSGAAAIGGSQPGTGQRQGQGWPHAISHGYIARKGGLSLFLWLLNEKGADENGTTGRGQALSILRPSSTFSLPCWTVVRTPLDRTHWASLL